MTSGSLPQYWQDRERARLQKVSEHVVDEHVNETTKPVGALMGGVYTSVATTYASGDFVPLNFSVGGSLKVGSDFDGTVDSAAPTKRSVIGGVAETTVPVAVSDGDVVNPWYDEYGRQVLFGANLASDALDVNVVNPALLNTVESVALNAVTTIGASSSYDMSNYNKMTFYFVGTSVTGDATLSIQSSYAGSNWANLTNISIATSETVLLSVSDEKHKYVRANLTKVGTSGTFTINLIGGN